MSAGQARHEHGTARIGFDAAGTILAASLDHVQDVGAYPTPWPVGTGAATGMIFPGPYRVPAGTFKLMSSSALNMSKRLGRRLVKRSFKLVRLSLYSLNSLVTWSTTTAGGRPSDEGVLTVPHRRRAIHG